MKGRTMMENNMIEQAEQLPVEALAVTEEPAAEQENTAEKELLELQEALCEAKTKLALLMCGASKAKISEAARLAQVLVASGAAPEEAAAAVLQDYPHLKLTTREVPSFAAAASGSGDGFSAIRNIFARK